MLRPDNARPRGEDIFEEGPPASKGRQDSPDVFEKRPVTKGERPPQAAMPERPPREVAAEKVTKFRRDRARGQEVPPEDLRSIEAAYAELLEDASRRGAEADAEKLTEELEAVRGEQIDDFEKKRRAAKDTILLRKEGQEERPLLRRYFESAKASGGRALDAVKNIVRGIFHASEDAATSAEATEENVEEIAERSGLDAAAAADAVRKHPVVQKTMKEALSAVRSVLEDDARLLQADVGRAAENAAVALNAVAPEHADVAEFIARGADGFEKSYGPAAAQKMRENAERLREQARREIEKTGKLAKMIERRQEATQQKIFEASDRQEDVTKARDALRTEKSQAEADLAELRENIDKARDGGEKQRLESALPRREKYIRSIEDKIQSREQEISAFQEKIKSLKSKIYQEDERESRELLVQNISYRNLLYGLEIRDQIREKERAAEELQSLAAAPVTNRQELSKELRRVFDRYAPPGALLGERPGKATVEEKRH